jgi:hypothetical protein
MRTPACNVNAGFFKVDIVLEKTCEPADMKTVISIHHIFRSREPGIRGRE